jgi:multimeric flavodoxin WrbA
MKVLTIMGGPRRGYGTIVMQKLEEELGLFGDVDFEYLYLKDVNLEQCRGCLNCFFKGEDKCPLANDDRDEIYNKIVHADGIVFMAPTYSLHVPALMKNFFDRFAYIFHRPCFFGKIAIGVSNQGIYGAKAVTSYFDEVANAWGFNFVNHLELRTNPYGGAEKKMIKKIKKTCKIFMKALKEKKNKKPSLGDVIGFKVRKLMYNIAKDETDADYNYWFEQGWLDDETQYYYDIKIGIIKKIITGLINVILKPKFKKMFAGDPKLINKQYLKLESLKF